MRGLIQEKLGRLMLLTLILLAVQSGSAYGYPDFVGYVNDYAHLLSAPQASALNQELRDFDNRTTIELAVVTVNSIGSENPQDYAVNLANYWGIGKRDKNNGIIFLVAMESHDIWIEVGPGLSDRFINSRVQSIVDNVIIPQFRSDRPDLGVISGVNSIIGHFSSPSPSQAELVLVSLSQNGDIEIVLRLIGFVAFLAILVLSIKFGVNRWWQAKKNIARIKEFKNSISELVDREINAIEALKDLKANYAPAIWKYAEEEFSQVDHEMLELELSRAEEISNKGITHARAAQSQINELEGSFEKAQRDVDAPINKLREVKSAQQDCAAILAGLDASFSQAEKEITGSQVSMATSMNLETARYNYQTASSVSKQPANTVDFIVLLNNLIKIRDTVEQISKDAVRDRAIAEKIQGQEPDELLAKMKQTLDSAEKSSDVAQADLKAAKSEYDKAQEYRSGRMNTIDLYLIMMRINHNIEQGHQNHLKAVEARRKAEALAKEKATAVHFTGFGSSGSRSFGGGRMGGGSHGGGKW